MIKIDKVEKIFPSGDENVVALSHISLEIPDHSFISVIGSSGSGKSTLLNLIGGLDKPTSGKIIMDHIELSSLNEKELARFRNQSMGFIFQQFMLLKDFTILENVMLPHYIATENKKLSLQKAEELLERFHLGHKAKQYPHEISGGEAQRIAIARALINKPNLILADEPTGSLDEKNQNLVFQILSEMRKDYPFTLILATHNIAYAKRANLILELSFGHLKWFGPPQGN